MSGKCILILLHAAPVAAETGTAVGAAVAVIAVIAIVVLVGGYTTYKRRSSTSPGSGTSDKPKTQVGSIPRIDLEKAEKPTKSPSKTVKTIETETKLEKPENTELAKELSRDCQSLENEEGKQMEESAFQKTERKLSNKTVAFCPKGPIYEEPSTAYTTSEVDMPSEKSRSSRKSSLELESTKTGKSVFLSARSASSPYDSPSASSETLFVDCDEWQDVVKANDDVKYDNN